MIKLIMKINKIFRGGLKVFSETKANIHCLEYKDGDYFICHCLEFDIVGQGKTQQEAREELADLIKEQIEFATEEDIEEKILFHPAPVQYWQTLSHFRNRLARRELLKHPSISRSEILDKFECTYAHI